MPENIKEETRKIDRFNIWIYVGFVILGLLLIALIIGLLFSFTSSTDNHIKSSSPVMSSNSYVKSSSPIINTNNFKSYQAPITNDRSKYMSSLFKYGGGFRNRLKRY